MEKPVLILGTNGIGKSAMEAFIGNNVVVYGFLDDDPEMLGNEIGEVTVLGNLDDNDYMSIIGKDCEAFIATEEIEVRKNLVSTLIEQRKVMPVNAIHSMAMVSPLAEIGHGNYIGPGAVLGSYAKVGNHTLINSGAVINHDTEVGDYSQIGAGSTINSGVKIGQEVFVGSGVVIVSGITIANGARIGAGSVVIKNVKEGETVFGNPATPV